MENGEELLYKLFGINAELLIDHAWGYEPCGIADAKAYTPGSKSIGNGQVLKEPYEFEKARTVLKEMADSVALDLVRKGMVCSQVVVSVGYDTSSLLYQGSRIVYKSTGKVYKGSVGTDHYGRPVPHHAHGSYNFDKVWGKHTSAGSEIIKGALEIFDSKVDKDLLIRRLNVTAAGVIPESEMTEEVAYTQLDLFTDYAAIEREKEAEKHRAERERRLQTAMLSIKDKFGKNAVLRGISFTEGATARERNTQVGGHRGGEEDVVSALTDPDAADISTDGTDGGDSP